MHKDEVLREVLHEKMQPIIDTLDDQVEARPFCENLRDRAGVIADYGVEHYIFRHKSLREYLAGLELLKQAREHPKRMTEIARHVGDDWWDETLRFFMAESDDKLFDRFMQAFFKTKSSNELDPKVQAFLRTLITEAPQKRVDSLVKCLRDGRVSDRKKRYVLDFLRSVGSKDALNAIRDFEGIAEGEAARVAEEIIAQEHVVVQGSAHVEVIDKQISKSVKSFRNPYELGAEYVLIPEGSYIYKQGGEEKQVGNVYFARYPVTNKRYRQFIEYLAGGGSDLLVILPLARFEEQFTDLLGRTRGFRGYLKKQEGGLGNSLKSRYEENKRLNDGDQPVVGVTWYAAMAYCVWLSELGKAARGQSKEGMVYRLPTEIEWQWAASGGEGGYPWGNEQPDEKRANYNRNVGATTTVGSYPKGATPEGLMDMAGNVWEWMGERYGQRLSNISLRGGSWYDDVNWLRCAARSHSHPSHSNYTVGFRVVRSQS